MLNLSLFSWSRFEALQDAAAERPLTSAEAAELLEAAGSGLMTLDTLHLCRRKPEQTERLVRATLQAAGRWEEEPAPVDLPGGLEGLRLKAQEGERDAWAAGAPVIAHLCRLADLGLGVVQAQDAGKVSLTEAILGLVQQAEASATWLQGLPKAAQQARPAEVAHA